MLWFWSCNCLVVGAVAGTCSVRATVVECVRASYILHVYYLRFVRLLAGFFQHYRCYTRKQHTDPTIWQWTNGQWQWQRQHIAEPNFSTRMIHISLLRSLAGRCVYRPVSMNHYYYYFDDDGDYEYTPLRSDVFFRLFGRRSSTAVFCFFLLFCFFLSFFLSFFLLLFFACRFFYFLFIFCSTIF